MRIQPPRNSLINGILIGVICILLVIAFVVAQGKGQQHHAPDIQVISFPYREGVIYRDDQSYKAEKRLQRWYSKGYAVEAVIEPTHSKGRPILILKRP